MVKASCHCGNVVLQISDAPAEVTECNCSICRRYGTLWAYYVVTQVEVQVLGSANHSYRWDDRAIAFWRCGICGCVTHWTGLLPSNHQRIGVNARLMDPATVVDAKLRHLDGANTEQYLD